MRYMIPLGEVAEFINGAAFKPEDWHENGRKIIRIQNLNDSSKPYNLTTRNVDKKYEVNTGDILVSWSASLGVFEWLEMETAWLNQHIFKAIPDKAKVHKNYFKYSLGKALNDMECYLHGATMKHVNRKEFLSTKIYVPPLEEQRRIAAILDKADGVRRKRKEAIRLTEELLKSTFLEMFGDPVTNPKGWEICSMKKIVVETQYGTAEKSQEVMGGLPILRMNNITYSGEIDLNSLKWCQIPPKDEDKFTVKRGDLLFNRTNSPELVGKTAVWRSDGKFAYAGYLIRVRFDKSKANSEYVSAFLNSNYGKRYLLEKAKPSINMSNFSASEFLKIPILLPDIETQHRFDEFVSYTRMMSQHLSDGLGDYNNLFNSLLQRAFRGEL